MFVIQQNLKIPIADLLQAIMLWINKRKSLIGDKLF